MRYYIKPAAAIMLLWLWWVPQQVYACGACGCALNNYNPELLINSGNHSISLFNTFKLYNGYVIADGHNADGAAGESLHYRQLMTGLSLSGVYYPHPKVYLSASLPLNHITLFVNDEKQESRTGIGDAMLTAGYQLVGDTKKLKEKGIQQRFIINGGVKLPTGSWKKTGYNGVWSPERQMGTGSVDFLAGVNYFFKKNNYGFNFDAGYMINTTNTKQFRFGNTINGNVSAFYLHKIRRVSIAPNAGLQVESSGSSTWYGKEYYEPTGGTILLASIGADLYYRNFGLSLEYFQPLLNKMNGEQMENKLRVQVGLRYIISKKRSTSSSNNTNQ